MGGFPTGRKEQCGVWGVWGVAEPSHDPEKSTFNTRTLGTEAVLQKGFPGGSAVKNAPVNAGNEALIPGRKDLLEKEIETRSSILVWRIPWMEEPGGLQSMALLRVRES